MITRNMEPFRPLSEAPKTGEAILVVSEDWTLMAACYYAEGSSEPGWFMCDDGSFMLGVGRGWWMDLPAGALNVMLRMNVIEEDTDE